MESETLLTSEIITKYNTSATICGKVYKKLKELIISNNERNIKNLSTIGNQMILSELSTIYKKEKDKNIAFPISISLNNIISNVGSSNTIDIKDTDIIKIKLGVSLGGCISILTETFVIQENSPIENVIKFLNNISEEILDMIKDEETVDEIRIFIESQCTNKDVFPIANCISYQQDKSLLKFLDSKYMLLHYLPRYDLNTEYLITPENTNFEFEEDDIFTINLTVIPIEDETDPRQVKYKSIHEPSIYRITDTNYNLKLKSSKEFYSKVKKEHGFYAFEINKYSTPKDRIGISECTKHNLLESYPIITPHNNLPVISKEFTIIVGKHNSKKLLYKLN